MAKTPKTPYTSVSDVAAFFSRIETIAEPKPPKKVDSSWVATYGFKTAHPSAIPSMLLWLGAINDDGESTGVWNDLRVDSTRQPTLERLVRDAYSAIFDAIDVGKADMRDLRGAFVGAYGIGDPGRHIKCFVALCREAGIATSVEAQSRERVSSQAKPKSAKPKRAESASAETAKGPRTTTHRRPRDEAGRAPDATSEMKITLNVEIPADWTDDQIRERIAVVRQAAEGQ